MARDGIDGLTHRAVARQADVPLGSTTYHFAGKDDLLNSAVELAQSADREMLAQALERFGPHEDLAGALAQLIEHLTVHDRERLLFDYELFLAARQRPALAASARRWVDDTEALIGRFTDARTARVLIHMVEGMLAESVVLHEPMPAHSIEPDFRRVLAG
ncbi:HTH-type transcriptional regulator RcdA [Capillimicrobium parvum]|uniref:HTH-type transcriptional regulator RcdA n=1 Tax=Capillimicrobium parvum TaxID=2884022 RepID=A0A9E6Y0S3_9ACTN|nr:HTH-type transcriptional regulator RcdA [Capillimicrobium parvum]